MKLDWLHMALACLLLTTAVAWGIALNGWHVCHAEREIIVLQVREWQVEELWSDELETEWEILR